jgi:four helix bundle protein
LIENLNKLKTTYIENFTQYNDLNVWKKAISLVSFIYKNTMDFPKEETYGLTNQIRRSAVSIPSNIAEGCGRHHLNDSLHFYYISRGSLFELETQLYIALDLSFISKNIFDEAILQITECKKLLNGFINYYKNLEE